MIEIKMYFGIYCGWTSKLENIPKNYKNKIEKKFYNDIKGKKEWYNCKKSLFSNEDNNFLFYYDEAIPQNIKEKFKKHLIKINTKKNIEIECEKLKINIKNEKWNHKAFLIKTKIPNDTKNELRLLSILLQIENNELDSIEPDFYYFIIYPIEYGNFHFYKSN